MDVGAKGQKAFEADQARLESFCESNNIRVVDDIRHILQITDRIYFNQRMQNLLDRQTWQIRRRFKMPANVEFYNDESNGKTVDERLAEYEEAAEVAGLQYPVLCKLQTGQKSTYAHTFFCANNQAGMREALAFAGFRNVKLLV